MTSRAHPLRLLAVSGSLQRSSANRAVLDVIAARADDIVIVDDYRALDQIPAFNPDHVDTPSAAVAEWRRRVGSADAVLIATPEYAGAMPGALKNALDWIVTTGELYRKPAAVVSAASTGGRHARRMTVQTLTWQGAYVVSELGIAGPRTRLDDNGELTDPGTLRAICDVREALVQAALATPTELAETATRTLGSLGVEATHLAPPYP